MDDGSYPAVVITRLCITRIRGLTANSQEPNVQDSTLEIGECYSWLHMDTRQFEI